MYDGASNVISFHWNIRFIWLKREIPARLQKRKEVPEEFANICFVQHTPNNSLKGTIFTDRRMKINGKFTNISIVQQSLSNASSLIGQQAFLFNFEFTLLSCQYNSGKFKLFHWMTPPKIGRYFFGHKMHLCPTSSCGWIWFINLAEDLLQSRFQRLVFGDPLGSGLKTASRSGSLIWQVFFLFWVRIKFKVNCRMGIPVWALKLKNLYRLEPSTLNIDLIPWHKQLIVCAVKC